MSSAAGEQSGMQQDEQKPVRGERPRWVRWLLRALVALAAVAVALVAALLVYASDYYHAGPAAQAALASDSRVTVWEVDGGDLVFRPAQDAEPADGAGLVFYPGGKVEYTAYAPLMRACAERGVTCVLVRMPLNLAVLDPNAADGVAGQVSPDLRWYVGGHSLGGAMAATYADAHADSLDGLVLLGAYSTADLTDTSLSALCAYGTEDGVLNRQKYEEDRDNLPADTREDVIQGGCHAYFGDYGAQEGDGTPTISREDQTEQAAEAIEQLVENAA